MTDPMLTAPAVTHGSPSPLLTVRTQVALLGVFLTFAASGAIAQSIDLGPITELVCGLAEQLKAPTLLGAAGLVIVLVFGWNKLMGENSAFQGLKNGVIGGMIILAAGTIASALFKGSC